MFVINKEIYGFLIQPQDYKTVPDAINVFNQFKIDALGMYVRTYVCLLYHNNYTLYAEIFKRLIFHGRKV